MDVIAWSVATPQATLEPISPHAGYGVIFFNSKTLKFGEPYLLCAHEHPARL